MTDEPSIARQEWRLHWPLVLAAAMGFAFMSIMTSAAGVFMEPLAAEFGWSRTQLSLGMGLSAIIGVFASPFFGLVIDRMGARRLALPGIVLAALVIASFGLLNGTAAQWIGLWIAWGIASLFVQSTIWSTAIVGSFSAGRGLALGLTFMGTALAQVVAPPLANWLIAAHGWRIAYGALGLGWGGIAFLLCLFFFYDARDRHRVRSASASATATNGAELPGLTIGEAWRSTELWRLAISTFLIFTITIAVGIHQFPILVDAGATRAHAAWFASLSGVAAIFGKLVTGAVIDRVHARWVGAITLASTAIAYPLLMAPFRSLAIIGFAIAISGYAAGAKMQLCGYLTARYAGVRNYGAIFGFMTSAISLASGIGPVVAGIAYDHHGSYAPVLWAGTIISLASGLLVFTLGRYPDWTEGREPELRATPAA